MSGDVYAGFCEHRGVRFPPVTLLVDPRRAFGMPLVVHGGARVEDLDRWTEGTIATEQLGEAAQRLVSGESVAHLLGESVPASAHR